LDPPPTRAADDVDRQSDLANGALRLRRVVAGDADPEAGAPERLEAGPGVGVEVAGLEAGDVTGCLARGALALDVDARAQELEDLRVVPAARENRAEQREQREARHAEPVGPGRPEPGLVEQCLARVEEDRPDGHAASCRRLP